MAPPNTPSATLELARATQQSHQKFAEFRESLLRQISRTSSSASSKSGSSKVRQSTSPSPSSSVTSCDANIAMSGDRDDAYWERRRKNNEAAKRSRDARRAKEQEVAVRAQFLEQENISMKMEIAHLKAENAQLRSKFQQHLTLKL